MSSPETQAAERASFLAGFAANVRRVRVAKGPAFSQTRLAKLTRLHPSEIGKIERGVVDPRMTTVVILADSLGVTIDHLLVGLSVPPTRTRFQRDGISHARDRA
jgi:transcriptional regulator with XRE-family HTH domain